LLRCVFEEKTAPSMQASGKAECLCCIVYVSCVSCNPFHRAVLALRNSAPAGALDCSHPNFTLLVQNARIAYCDLHENAMPQGVKKKRLGLSRGQKPAAASHKPALFKKIIKTSDHYAQTIRRLDHVLEQQQGALRKARQQKLWEQERQKVISLQCRGTSAAFGVLQKYIDIPFGASSLLAGSAAAVPRCSNPRCCPHGAAGCRFWWRQSHAKRSCSTSLQSSRSS
jgi:hypothetical protein